MNYMRDKNYKLKSYKDILFLIFKMANFIQLFNNDTDIIDVQPILSKIAKPPDDLDDIAEFVTDFPDSAKIVDKYLMQYVDNLNQEINYFRDFKQNAKYSYRTKIIYCPKHTYIPYKCEDGAGFGSLLNFHIYLNDCNTSIVEIFSPFTNSFQRFKPRAGLVLIFPAFWGVMIKMTSTLEESLLYIKGTIRVGV